MALVGSLQISITANTSGLQQGTQQATMYVNNLNISLTKAQAALLGLTPPAEKAQAALTGVGKAAIQFAAAYVGVNAIKMHLTDLIHEGSKIETLRAAFIGLGGSIEAGNKSFAIALETANKYGFAVTDVGKSLMRLQEASKGAGLGIEAGERLFKASGATARALGFTSEEMKRMLLAMQQMLSKGKVNAEEMRSQLAEVLPGAITIFARAMGVPIEVFSKMMERGELVAGILIPRVTRQLEKEFGVKATQSLNTLAVSSERLANAWAMLGEQVVKTGVPAAMVDTLRVAVEFWEKILHLKEQYDGAGTKSGGVDITQTRQFKDYYATLAAVQKSVEIQKDLAGELEKLKASGADKSTIDTYRQALDQEIESYKKLNDQLEIQRLALEKVKGFVDKSNIKASEKEAEVAKVTAEEEAQKVIREEGVNLQRELNKLYKEYQSLVEATNAQIAQDPASREDALEKLIAQSKKIIAVTESLRSRERQFLDKMPGVGGSIGEGGKASLGVSQERWDAAMPIIRSIAQQYGVDPNLAGGVAIRESGLDPRAKSKAGAAGIMQLMPGTAADMGVTNVWDIVQNVTGGIKYLAQQLKQSGGDIDKALANYNYGPGNVAKHGMGALPKETRDYLVRVKSNAAVLASQGEGGSDKVASGAEEATRQIDEMHKGLVKAKEDLVEIGNQDKYIKIFVNLQAELDRIKMWPEDFEATQLDRMNTLSKTVLEFKLKFAEAPQAMAEWLKGAIENMRESVDTAFEAFTLKQVRIHLEQEVTAMTGDLVNQAAEFRRQIQDLNLGAQNPEAMRGLGMTDAETNLKRYAASPRMQESAKMLVELSKIEATGGDTTELRAAYAKQKQTEGLAAGARFLQQLQDELDTLTKTEKALQALRLATDGASAAQIKEAEALRISNKEAKYGAQLADFMTDIFDQIASGAKFNFASIGYAFSRMLMGMIIDASGVKQDLTKLFQEILGGDKSKGSGLGGLLGKGIGAIAGLFGGGGGVPLESSAPLGGMEMTVPMQHGGPVMPGRAYTVGEHGAETFVPRTAGSIIPNGGIGGVSMVMNVYANDVGSFQRSSGEIQAKMLGAMRRAQRNA